MLFFIFQMKIYWFFFPLYCAKVSFFTRENFLCFLVRRKGDSSRLVQWKIERKIQKRDWTNCIRKYQIFIQKVFCQVEVRISICDFDIRFPWLFSLCNTFFLFIIFQNFPLNSAGIPRQKTYKTKHWGYVCMLNANIQMMSNTQVRTIQKIIKWQNQKLHT